jgi:hypothetical protein
MDADEEMKRGWGGEEAGMKAVVVREGGGVLQMDAALVAVLNRAFVLEGKGDRYLVCGLYGSTVEAEVATSELRKGLKVCVGSVEKRPET